MEDQDEAQGIELVFDAHGSVIDFTALGTSARGWNRGLELVAYARHLVSAYGNDKVFPRMTEPLRFGGGIKGRDGVVRPAETSQVIFLVEYGNGHHVADFGPIHRVTQANN